MDEKSVFFDSSTIISMALSCALPLLKNLKENFGGKFYITESVYGETIERALQSLRFKYEGYRIKELLANGILEIFQEKEIKFEINKYMDSLNRTYFIYNKPLNIFQKGEISTIIACANYEGSSLAIDERIARMLVEDINSLTNWLEQKFHAKVGVNKKAQKNWLDFSENLPYCIRSAELAVEAWREGFLQNLDQLYGLLWALKFSGCAITEQEINTYIKLLKKR